MDAEAGQHPARLKVGITGPGRVGAALGVPMPRAGHEVVAVAAVSDPSVQRAREHFPAARLTEPAGGVEAADLVLLTVPDDAPAGLVGGLGGLGAPGRACPGAPGPGGGGWPTPAAVPASGCGGRPPARGRCRWPCTRS